MRPKIEEPTRREEAAPVGVAVAGASVPVGEAVPSIEY